jgi:hypothetical protein
VALGAAFGLVARNTAPIDGDAAGLEDGARLGSCTGGLGAAMSMVTSVLHGGLASKGPR